MSPHRLEPDNKKALHLQGLLEDTANGIRTRVTAVRGRRPSPLDDGGVVLDDLAEAIKGPWLPGSSPRDSQRGCRCDIFAGPPTRMWRNW
jgi:hypothetical protein